MPKPKKATSARYAVVHWLDAHGSFDGDDVKPINALTAGWVITVGDDYLMIASEIFEDGTYRTTTAIPKGMIKAMSITARARMPKEFQGWKAKQK